jgi:hypothetical protein
MKIKVVVVDLELSRRAKRVAVMIAVSLVALTGGAIAYASLSAPLHTWAAGDTLTAADLNNNFSNLTSLDTRIKTLEGPVSRVELTGIGALSTSQGVFVAVPYATKTFDDLGEYDTSTSRFTPKAAGDYEVCSWVWAASGSNFELDLFVTGARQKPFAGTGSATGGVFGGCLVSRLAAGDYLDVRVLQNAAGTGSFTNGIWDWMTISRLR